MWSHVWLCWSCKVCRKKHIVEHGTLKIAVWALKIVVWTLKIDVWTAKKTVSFSTPLASPLLVYSVFNFRGSLANWLVLKTVHSALANHKVLYAKKREGEGTGRMQKAQLSEWLRPYLLKDAPNLSKFAKLYAVLSESIDFHKKIDRWCRYIFNVIIFTFIRKRTHIAQGASKGRSSEETKPLPTVCMKTWQGNFCASRRSQHLCKPECEPWTNPGFTWNTVWGTKMVSVSRVCCEIQLKKVGVNFGFDTQLWSSFYPPNHVRTRTLEACPIMIDAPALRDTGLLPSHQHHAVEKA